LLRILELTDSCWAHTRPVAPALTLENGSFTEMPSMTSVLIRSATAADLPAMLALYNQAILQSTSSYHYEPRTAGQWSAWYEEKLAGGWPIFVAAVSLDDDTVQHGGWATFGHFRGPWAGYRFSVEHSVYVSEALRRQGRASLHLHEQLGFVEVGRCRQVGYKFDRWLDLLFYQLLLE
jgi:phosphinothricin acetyltransferase